MLSRTTEVATECRRCKHSIHFKIEIYRFVKDISIKSLVRTRHTRLFDNVIVPLSGVALGFPTIETRKKRAAQTRHRRPSNEARTAHHFQFRFFFGAVLECALINEKRFMPRRHSVNGEAFWAKDGEKMLNGSSVWNTA